MGITTKLVACTATLGLLVGAMPSPMNVAAPSAPELAGEAFGTYANTALASQEKSPLAVVTAGSMDEDQALSISVPGVITAENLFSIASGAGDTHDAGAESSSSAEKVSILDGLITADGVVAIASSAIHGTMVDSNSEGSGFAGLVVNGVAMPALPAPNTRVELPGVGVVILNEQTRHGDGLSSTGLSVNMIHVILQDALTGATTGEIIVGAASSRVVQ